MSVLKKDPAIERIVPSEVSVATLVEGLASGEGPVWMEEAGYLLFSEVGIAPAPDGFKFVNDGRRHCWDSRTRATMAIYEPTHMTNGMTRDCQGRLVMCEYESRRVTRLEPDGTYTVIASHYRGQRLSAPNDVVVKSDGSIYFTDTGGVQAGLDLDYSAVFRVATDLSAISLVAHEFQLVNGFPWHSRPMKACSTSTTRRVSTPIQALSTAKGRFAPMTSDPVACWRTAGCSANCAPESGMPDGMKCDSEGNVYCTGPGGIWIIDAAGKHRNPAHRCATQRE